MKHSNLSALLKDKESIYQKLTTRQGWSGALVTFAIVGIIGMAIFGLIMSAWIPHGWHALDLSWKTIALIWGPIAICTPALFVFGAIRGSKITLLELIFLLAGAMATTGIVLMALSPLTGFFTWTTDTVIFMKIMNGLFIGLALAFGMFFFSKGLLYINAQNKAAGKQTSAAVDIVVLWFILLIIVVSQMSSKLGPWYEVRTVPIEYSNGSQVFPDNPKGDFIEAPHIVELDSDKQVINWIIDDSCTVENYVEIVEANYTAENNAVWTKRYAECTTSTTGEVGLRCTVPLLPQWQNDSTWKAQAHSQLCGGPLTEKDLVSDVFTFTY